MFTQIYIYLLATTTTNWCTSAARNITQTKKSLPNLQQACAGFARWSHSKMRWDSFKQPIRTVPC